jgi:upstream activation factor subunit UAF30
MATKTGSKGGGKGLSAAVQPSSELAAIVGNEAIPRSEVTKRVWDYIKANGLQDQTNKRMINADDKLRTIFGGKDQVSMFEMTALVSKHLKS